MTIRRFQLESGMDMSITLDINTAVVTEEIANQVANFWSSRDEVEEASVDVWEAVARYAAGPLLRSLMEGYNETGALQTLHAEEGWCWPGEFGITIDDHELPDMSAAYGFKCTELEVPSE